MMAPLALVVALRAEKVSLGKFRVDTSSEPLKRSVFFFSPGFPSETGAVFQVVVSLLRSMMPGSKWDDRL